MTSRQIYDLSRPAFVVPPAKLAASAEEEAAVRRRRELREKLLRGEQVVVTQFGMVTDQNNQNPNQPAIVVPEGKLAASFYWYERNANLLAGEKEAMRRYFPQFQMEKLVDGRLSWIGVLAPTNVRPGAQWYLQAVYENNHPNNSTYGGSIKVYSIEPDLEEVMGQIGQIPHVLRDSRKHLYLCTSRPEDFRASAEVSTTAASALAWAAKWIAAFELWIAGDISTAEFSGHRI